jgi:hypothetical protein
MRGQRECVSETELLTNGDTQTVLAKTDVIQCVMYNTNNYINENPEDM